MDGPAVESRFEPWLRTFALDGFIHLHVAAVMQGLPDMVRSDLSERSQLSDDGLRAGTGRRDARARCVAELREALPRGRPQAHAPASPHRFVRYVIAHELAHAHLFNRGRSPDEDPEFAADELAAAWGFPKPRSK